MYRRNRSTGSSVSNVSFFDLYGEEWMEAPEELLSEEDVTFLKTPSPYGERFKEASKGEAQETVIAAPAVPSMPDSRAKKMVFSDGRGRTKMCALIKRKLRSFSTKTEPLKIKSYTDDETIEVIHRRRNYRYSQRCGLQPSCRPRRKCPRDFHVQVLWQG